MVKIWERDEKGNFVNVAEKEKITVFEQLILNMTEEEFWECNLTPYDASLYMNKNTRSCLYYGQRVKLTGTEFETLISFVEAKNYFIKTVKLEKILDATYGTTTKRIERVNEKFNKIDEKNEIILNEEGLGYYLNTDIIDPLRLIIIQKEDD